MEYVLQQQINKIGFKSLCVLFDFMQNVFMQYPMIGRALDSITAEFDKFYKDTGLNDPRRWQDNHRPQSYDTLVSELESAIAKAETFNILISNLPTNKYEFPLSSLSNGCRSDVNLSEKGTDRAASLGIQVDGIESQYYRLLADKKVANGIKLGRSGYELKNSYYLPYHDKRCVIALFKWDDAIGGTLFYNATDQYDFVTKEPEFRSRRTTRNFNRILKMALGTVREHRNASPPSV